jgi:hypothetical protein
MWGLIVAALLGLWLMAAPAVMGYGAPASTVDRIVGPVAAALATIGIWEVTRPLRWTLLPLGLVLAVAPLLLDYGVGAMANSLVVGALLAALSLVRGSRNQRFGGGWSSLWPPCGGDREPGS